MHKRRARHLIRALSLLTALGLTAIAPLGPAAATGKRVPVVPYGAHFYGSVPPSCSPPACPMAITYWPGQASVAIMATPTGNGYWVADNFGNVYKMGDAKFYGSAGRLHLTLPIRAAAATPTGKGYWLFARDGGVFSFGDARFYGSTGNIHLDQPIVTAASTPSGKGYWLFAADGGVFSFGDARFYGSMGNIHLDQPIVTASATATGKGYRLFAADGGVLNFGDAKFYGSAANVPGRFVAGASRPQNDGYWIVTDTGRVYGFGKAFSHTNPEGGKWARTAAAAVHPTGTGLWLAQRDGGVGLVSKYPVLDTGGVTCPSSPVGRADIQVSVGFESPWDFPKGKYAGPRYPASRSEANPGAGVPTGTGTTVDYWHATYSTSVDGINEYVHIYFEANAAGTKISQVRLWVAPNGKKGGAAGWMDFSLGRTYKIPACP